MTIQDKMQLQQLLILTLRAEIEMLNCREVYQDYKRGVEEREDAGFTVPDRHYEEYCNAERKLTRAYAKWRRLEDSYRGKLVDLGVREI